jgi:hypothetical protein
MAKAKFTKTIDDDTAYAAMKQAYSDGCKALRISEDAPQTSPKEKYALSKLHGKQDYAK